MTIASVSCELVTISNSLAGHWVEVPGRDVPLRSWWADADQKKHDIESITVQNRVVIVLPEVFGINRWVRSVAGRIASSGVPALAMPLFARTAPSLDLGYSDSDLIEGRRHKDATTTDQIRADVSASIAWLLIRYPEAVVTVVGFCFGGHAALLAATDPNVHSSFNFYGAGVSRMRPGGGSPSLDLLPKVKGQLTCLCGTADPLIPADHRSEIQTALRAEDPSGSRLAYVEVAGADHGFMCEARSSFDAQASQLGWSLLWRDLQTRA
ncbi:dienelactone hydrolase family protein [Synechococcus sp. KORDI-100]|uniref:dienelactone hydrolase family protein n=1 Tax=Synechococcus sp. KORDI-100 TaxID=1280380 RepID=UPI000B1E6B7E